MTEHFHPEPVYELLAYFRDSADEYGRVPLGPMPQHLHEWTPYGEDHGLIVVGVPSVLLGPGKWALQEWEQRRVADDQPATPKTAGMLWQEAASRMEQLRLQGEPFPSQHQLANQFRCSSGTINKAIAKTPTLQAWAKPDATAPRAQSINEVVTDRVAQSREPNPEDDAAIREYIEREDITPDERAFFLGLSRDDQLDFLDDPDQHHRILGRQP